MCASRSPGHGPGQSHVNVGAIILENRIVSTGPSWSTTSRSECTGTSRRDPLWPDVRLGDRCLTGMGVMVMQGRRVGSRPVGSAGAVVVPEVPDGSLVVGVPVPPTKGGPDR